MVIVHPTVICDRDIISTSIYTPLNRWVRVDIVSATVPSRFLGIRLLRKGLRRIMMEKVLLMQYAKDKNILKTRVAIVSEVRDNGSEVTILYKVDGQRYANGQPSARTLSRSVADTIEVDKATGQILSGQIVKKSNFWVWQPSSDSDDEA